ncbi:hypothetical protein F5B22DRAFT_88810 [Xylaria bambusicola]|uniref:uncharacterized protein n=1 Tax=Xylaria bambusicola TaxID=326684 RepID=UPI00200722FD|nr:uncharacterized protein F5B22DRAFT_88810 [Xylaria bambusicola]KAI0518033.1 hypothetical protein F5B22DRAFT_88810 [Xylaria bambusicola]
MGGGIKSRFKFPVPGRSSKKQQAQTLAVPVPLSKAQRILGADGINIGSSRLTVEPSRAWETGSTGGISISISESSASEAAHDIGLEKEYGRTRHWEEESAIIPRHNRSAHGSAHRGLAGSRSPYIGGNESRDNVTNTSTRGRQLSSSTIDTHYDATKMPLAISQQTSNSAMAKGLPTKVNELLDIDGSLAGPQTMKKKKPAKLDFSRLRPKGHKDRTRNSPNTDPILGNNYVMRSPSFMAQTPRSPMMSGSTVEERQRTPRKLMKQHTVQQSRSKGVTEATGLHQLYHHYEQMSFQDEQQFVEEVEPEHLAAYSERSSDRPRPASIFTHSLIAPLPVIISRGQDARSNHSRNNSHDSRVAASIAESTAGLQVHPASRGDYAGSISSRHTRTSKASPSSKSLLESDRLQSSVLSLSDSSDDEAIGPTSSTPSHREGVIDDEIPEYPVPNRAPQNFNHLHGVASPRKFTPSLNQVDEHLAVKSAPRAHTSRSPSNYTGRSSQSSMSTLTSAHPTVPFTPASRISSRSADTIDTMVFAHQAGYSVQEATTVSFVPLVSTVEAASNVSLTDDAHHLEKVLLRQNSTATSRVSHSSDQPTPPLSPNSMEFYMPSRESLQRQAMANGSSEAHNARMMAVTRQEEMLLAALRQKRAKMRETTISESEEDGSSRADISNRGSPQNVKRSSPTSNRETLGPLVNPWPKRASSLFVTGSQSRDVDVPSTASRSDATDRTSTSATGSTSLATPDSRHEQISLYLDHPIDDTNTRDTSLDFSDDYMDDSDGEDLIVNERRSSRMQSRRDSASGPVRGRISGSTGNRRGSSSYSSRSQTDSISTDSLGAPARVRRLQDVPEVESRPPYIEYEDDEDDLGDLGLDGFPQPPMPPPSWPLPPRPGKPSTQNPNSPPSADFLHPSSAMQQGLSPERKIGHVKSKRSMVRLSAVGSPTSPMPWMGDDN